MLSPCGQLHSLVAPCFLLAALVAAQGSPTSLRQIDQILLSTARDDFAGDDAIFGAATAWHGERLLENPTRKAPHLACAEYSKGRHAMKKLEGLLSKEALRRASNHKEHGACFFATASFSEAKRVSEDLAGYGLTSFAPVPSALKLAPGLLNHEGLAPASGAGKDQDQRLTTTHGERMRFGNVAGLDVALSPGVLPAHDGKASAFISDLREDLMSASMDLHANSFWSDSDMLGDDSAGPAAALRGREWSRAATVVHELSAEGGPTPGDVCSWGDIQVHHASSDLLLIKGVDHLLHLGRGAGGNRGAESDELQIACLMGLVSFLATVPEVQRVSPFHASQLKNAVAGAIVQSGNIQDKPLTAAGLDGTGEVVQIIDTGLDETSCYFADEDGLPVDHGYYFEALGFVGEPSLSGNHIAPFKGGSFPFDLGRRKIVQYIRMVRDDYPESPYGEYGSLTTGEVFPWYEEYGFGMDMEAGHGTHTAGSVAGEPLSTPAELVECPAGGEVGCIGECTSTDTADDNLLTWNRLCPQFDCDGFPEGDGCLSENIAETLTDNGGVARGAKISVFDASIDGTVIWASLVGNGLWNATLGTGCMLHSNSWGADGLCTIDSETVEFDKFMYDNPEHLLLFAAGNDGAPEDSFRTSCTINIPGIGKNVMAVGSSSSGPTRWSLTAADGDAIEAFGPDHADIDTVSFFSSYGLTKDSRIKPEILAPGDQVLSAGSDGTGSHSCQLAASQGTSMSTPIAAGAAAMVRQYFKNSTFYEADVTQRGLCAELTNGTNAFACEAFSPSAATVKAMLVNSADLMGGSSEPDGYRGFGRVKLEAGLPLGGEGDQGLFVADAFQTEIEEYTIQEYEFNLVPGADVELRATLAWLDPPASAEASVQLMNDLDLTLVAPDKTTLYRMWSDGADNKNVIERVILPSSIIGEGGTWTVAVSCFGLTADTQPYSLVVTGPIDVESGAFSQREATGAAMDRVRPSMVVVFVTGFAVVFGMLAAAVPW